MDEVLLLIVLVFEKPAMVMNATPYQTVEACEESGKLLEYPEAWEPHISWYCEWRSTMPEKIEFTDEEIQLLEALAGE